MNELLAIILVLLAFLFTGYNLYVWFQMAKKLKKQYIENKEGCPFPFYFFVLTFSGDFGIFFFILECENDLMGQRYIILFLVNS